MSPISTVLLLATILFTSDGLPVGNLSAVIHHSSIRAEQKISKSHSTAPIHRKMAVEENWSDRSAEQQIILTSSADDPELDMSNSSAQLSGILPEDICDICHPCCFGICLPTSVYPGYECKCDDDHYGVNCELEKWAIGSIIFSIWPYIVGSLVGIPLGILLGFFLHFLYSSLVNLWTGKKAKLTDSRQLQVCQVATKAILTVTVEGN